MSEPFLERLSRFTPDAGRLDRDALLFAAGRSSVRPHRGWRTLASLLAATQVLSLVVLWPHEVVNPTSPGRTPNMAVEPASTRPTALEPRAFDAWASPTVLSSRRLLAQPESEDRPAANVNFVDSGPPLRASGPIPQSLLN
ncbi:MAG: hypothetical protein ACLQIB_24710 [Isosphaeraceae bacterium]